MKVRRIGSLCIAALLWVVPAFATPTAGTNQPPTAYGTCMGYQPGIGGDFCLNDGSASFWQKFIGDVTNDSRGTPQCSPTNTTNCGHLKVQGFQGVPLVGSPTDGQTFCYQASPGPEFVPCPGSGSGFVSNVTASPPLGSSGGATPNITASVVQGNGTKLQLSTGTTTTNDCVKYDANGNTVDAGVSCSSSGQYPSGAPPQIAGYSTTNTPEAETVSGDGSFARAGANSYTLTVTKINGTTPGGSCSAGSIVTSISASGVPTCTQKTDPFVCGSIPVPTNSQVLCDIPITKAETIPSNCTGSQAGSTIAATGTATFTINKIHSGSTTAAGTVAWSGSGTTGAFTCSGSTSFVAGDILQIVAPSSADATLAGLGIAISMNAGAL